MDGGKTKPIWGEKCVLNSSNGCVLQVAGVTRTESKTLTVKDILRGFMAKVLSTAMFGGQI